MCYVVTILVLLSAIFEIKSYYRQIRKIRRWHHSQDVSLSAYRDKLIKYGFGMLALIISMNYVGLALEVIALIMCLFTYYTIKRER